MNERIIKLFMQSVDTNYIPLPIEEHIPSWTEKFAELIVKETMQVVANNLPSNTYLDVADAVIEHFKE